MFIAVDGKLIKNLKTSFKYATKQYNATQNISKKVYIPNINTKTSAISMQIKCTIKITFI